MNLEGITTLDHASFTARSGEILGIAGVAGSGQKELLEAIAGLQPVQTGAVSFFPKDGDVVDTTHMSAEEIDKLGIHLAFVPEDRLGMGLVGSMDITENMMLRTYREGRSFFADKRNPRKLAERIVKQLEVVTSGIGAPGSAYVGRQRTKGARRARNRLCAERADGRLPRARAGH